MTYGKILKKTMLITLLVFLAFGIVYTLVWWLGFDKKFYPIEQVRNFIVPFFVSRWYDFGLICLWPIIITLLYKDSDASVFNVIGMICSFLFIGLPLNYWVDGNPGQGGFSVAVIFTIIGWILTEIFFFTISMDDGYNRKTIITEGLITNVFAGLGVALAFIFSKGLLIGLFFGFSVTVLLTVLLLVYNLVFKSILRLILNFNQDKKLITKAE